MRRLCEEREAGTILLAAPVGYGKSSLLCEWALVDERAFAWVELDASMDDPEGILDVLLRALASALGVERSPASASRSAFEQRASAARMDALLTLARSISANDPGVVLVLDELDRIESKQTLETIAELAHSLPPTVTLALSGCGEPHLRLARLRAARRLLRLGPAELAMTPAEVGGLLAAAGLSGGPEAVARLIDMTEGWPACLSLVIDSMRAPVEDGGADAQIARGEREVREYLREEVLAPLAPEARRVLTLSAVLEQLSGDLCDAVLGRRGTGRVLRSLATESMLLTPQDAADTWYRCHPMLRRALLADLLVGEPERLLLLHSSASDWFAAHGEIELAVGHAVDASDPGRAGRWMWEGTPRVSIAPQQFQRWLAAFTAAEIGSSAHLALVAAHSHLLAGELSAARHWARVCTEALQSLPETPASVQAGALLIEAAAAPAGVPQMVDDAGRAYGLLGEASSLRPLCCLIRGAALRLAERPEEAREYLREGADGYTDAVHSARAECLTQLALMDIEDGDWDRACDRAVSALADLVARGRDTHPTSALTLATAALTMTRSGPDHAKLRLATSERMLAGLGDYLPWYEVEARTVMARANVRLFDVARSRSLLSQASRWARRAAPFPSLLARMETAWGEIDDLSASALNGPGSLTMAELRVLRFLPTHLSFREIGDRLHVSGNTVKSQAHAVYAKLGARSRTEAVAHAAALGLVETLFT